MANEEKIKSIIAEQLGVKVEEVNPESSFVDDLGADSLDTVELIMALEEEFNVEIPDEENDGIPFKKKMQGLTKELEGQIAEEKKLNEEIKKQLQNVGFNLG